MGPFDGAVKGMPTLAKKKQNIVSVKKPIPPSLHRKPQPGLSTAPAPRPRINGKPNAVNGHARSQSRSATPAGLGSATSKDSVMAVKGSVAKRASPASSVPRFDDSDSDSDSEPDTRPTKRQKRQTDCSGDSQRQLMHSKFDSLESEDSFEMIHAVDIANYGTTNFADTKYSNFFEGPFQEDEDEMPTVELQYPGSFLREKYNFVRSRDREDYSPVNDIIDVVKKVAQNYVRGDMSLILDDPQQYGIAQNLEFARNRALHKPPKPGQQAKFLQALNQYNDIITNLRKNGSIGRGIDSLRPMPFLLIDTIMEQCYARTVSPHARLTQQYENGTSFVYGEIKPRFLSTILKETHLKSNQVFLDLGSGVGSLVLQAAVETGAESWGCEYMNNPAMLAEAQVKEFNARCRLWGIQPGAVHLIHGDFLKERSITDCIKRADVILINNKAFQADLDDAIKWLLLDCKEGCQVVTMKPIREPGSKIQGRHDNDPVYHFQVVKKYFATGSVSWQGEAGEWYLHTKDSKEIMAYRLAKGSSDMGR